MAGYYDLTHYRWHWYWEEKENGEADCGIVCAPREGHGYSVCRCPRYMSKIEWQALAGYICNLHNANYPDSDL